MPDLELANALKQAKSKPMFFAWVLKGGGDGKLIVSKTKIPMKDVLEIKKAIGGSKPITGKCSGALDSMTFQTGGVWPGVTENTIMKVVKRETGLTVDVRMEMAGHDKDMIEEDTEIAKEDAKIPPPLPIPKIGVTPGAEVDQLAALAQILDSIRPMKGTFPDGPRYNITLNMKDYELSQKEAETNRKNAAVAFAKGAQHVIQKAGAAMEDYIGYRELMTKGKVDRAITWIFDKFSVTDPEDRMKELCLVATDKAKAAMFAANSNKFVEAAGDLGYADTAASQAKGLIGAYKNGLERSAGSTVKGLEAVKTTCEITLVVGGAVVTGGGTVAFVGGTAMTAAEDLAPALYGDKVNWKKFAFDMALAGLSKKLGAGEKIEKAVTEKLAGKLGPEGAKKALAKITGGTMETFMKKCLEKSEKKFEGKDVKYEEVVEDAKKEALTEIAVGVASILKG